MAVFSNVISTVPFSNKWVILTIDFSNSGEFLRGFHVTLFQRQIKTKVINGAS